MATILTKKSDTSSSVPLAADLTNAAGGAELAVNTADKRLYSKTSGGSVVELGTNPSALSLPNGTANGVPYLNGSKVLTSGSALTFDGTNLGIGTTTPSFASGMGLALNGGGGQARLALKNNSTGDGALDGFQLVVGTDSTAFIEQRENAPMAFSVNNTEGMRLTSTGLGIGTSSPAAKLDVRGNAVFTGNGTSRQTADFTNTGGQLYVGTESSSGGAVFVGSSAYAGIVGTNTNTPLQLGTNGTIKATLDSSGNLGLGVTPSAWGSSLKAIQVNARGAFFANSTNTFVANNYYDDGSSYRYIASAAATDYYQASGAHIWRTAPSGTAGNAISFTQAMSLTAAGELLVGRTDNPSSARIAVLQQLNGANGEGFNLESSGAWATFVSRNTFTSYADAIIRSQSIRTASTAFKFYDGVADGQIQFVVLGNGNVQNINNSYGAYSDVKLKQDIVDAGSQWEDIKALRFRKYRMKADPNGALQLGLIAQEAERTSPGLVEETQDRNPETRELLGTTTKAIKYSVLYMKATKTLQEAQVRIESLETAVDQLKTRLAAAGI